MALFLLVPMLLGLLLFALSDRLGAALSSLDVTQTLLIAGVVLTAIDAGLLAAVMARFQRSRLLA